VSGARDEPIPLPYWTVSTLRPPGCTWKFGTETEALACAEEAAKRLRLRVLVTRIDPSEPELLSEIVEEFDGTLPF
jgi:hypothetical protein